MTFPSVLYILKSHDTIILVYTKTTTKSLLVLYNK